MKRTRIVTHYVLLREDCDHYNTLRRNPIVIIIIHNDAIQL